MSFFELHYSGKFISAFVVLTVDLRGNDKKETNGHVLVSTNMTRERVP